MNPDHMNAESESDEPDCNCPACRAQRRGHFFVATPGLRYLLPLLFIGTVVIGVIAALIGFAAAIAVATYRILI